MFSHSPPSSMGNTHFQVFHEGDSDIYTFTIPDEELNHGTLLRKVSKTLALPAYTQVTMYTNYGMSWVGIAPDTSGRWIKRYAAHQGRSTDPIQLRVVSKTPSDPASDDVVHFCIQDKYVNTRFRLPREGVTLAALQREAKQRYAKFARLYWSFEKKWTRVENDEDITYMFELAPRKKENTLQTIILAVDNAAEEADRAMLVNGRVEDSE